MADQPALLCVATFPANTGFAWTFLEGLYAQVADQLSAWDVRTLVAYPAMDQPPATLEGSAARAVTLSLEPRNPGQLLRIMRTVRREQVRAVYFTDRPARHWSYPFLRIAGVRLILVYDHTSGARTRPTGIKRALKWVAARIPLLGADTVAAVSESVALRHRDVAMTPSGRIRRIWNGVAVRPPGHAGERCGIPVTRPIIFCAGRATPEKGIEHLLRAFDRLTRTGRPESERPVLLVAGDGPSFEALAAVREELTWKADVILLGYRRDVPELTAGAEVCAVPSVWEDALPLAVLQAMAAAKPVVATRVGGIPEMIDSDAVGRLVPPGDVESLARAIDDLLADPAERRRIGGAAQQRVADQFRPQDQIEHLLDCLAPAFPGMGRSGP